MPASRHFQELTRPPLWDDSEVVIKNHGNWQAQGGRVDVWLNRTKAARQKEAGNGSGNYMPRAPGRSWTAEIYLRAPKAEGDYTLLAYVDTWNSANESEEHNNQKKLKYRIKAPATENQKHTSKKQKEDKASITSLLTGVNAQLIKDSRDPSRKTPSKKSSQHSKTTQNSPPTLTGIWVSHTDDNDFVVFTPDGQFLCSGPHQMVFEYMYRVESNTTKQGAVRQSIFPWHMRVYETDGTGRFGKQMGKVYIRVDFLKGSQPILHYSTGGDDCAYVKKNEKFSYKNNQLRRE
jgi:hypothetical protein